MNKLILFAFLSFLSFSAYAQVSFDPGYFINNEGKRVDALIRNADKLNNPTSIEYKLSESAETRTASIDSIQEFEIVNTGHKYKRFIVDVAQAKTSTKDLDYSREPVFEKKQLFLQVLVDGKASLYTYSSKGAMQLFFYKLDTTAVAQLVYKQYLIDALTIQENNAYKQQLWTNLKCPDFTAAQHDNLDYSERELVKEFIKYNNCAGAAFTNYLERKHKGEWAISFKGGVNVFSAVNEQGLTVLQYSRYNDATKTKYYEFHEKLQQRAAPEIGVEIEYILRFNKKRWSLFLEPSYQHHRHKYETLIYKPNQSKADPFGVKADTATLEANFFRVAVPFGIKHHIPIGTSTKVYLKAGFAFNIMKDPQEAIRITSSDAWRHVNEKKFLIKPALAAGFGLMFKSRLGLDLLFQPGSSTVVSPRVFIDKSRFDNSLSLSMKYRLN